MPLYRPKNTWESALATLSSMEGKAGRNARRWLRDRYGKRAVADFRRRLKQIGPGSVCLDLGANVGLISRQMAATGARVHAYEPDPLAFAELTRNLGHLPNVTLHQAAVAATGGRRTLRRRSRFGDDPLSHTITSTVENHMPGWFDGGEEIEVEVVAFTDVLALAGGPVDLIKIDIEGSELGILRGIFADPSACDVGAIYCETHEMFDRSLEPEFEAMRRASETLARPDINLYWP